MKLEELQKKFEQFRELIAMHTFYDIASALRGPDTDNAGLKWIFSSRIRHLLGVRAIAVTTRPRASIPLQWLEQALEKLTYRDSHYLFHVLSALSALHEVKAIDVREYWFLYYLADAYLTIAESLSSESKWIERVEEFMHGMDKLVWIINEYRDFVEV